MANDAAGQESSQPSGAKVFISYSRKDMAFADRLDAALKSRGLAPLIDRNEIFAFEAWWRRIEALITSADTVIYVLSPDSVSSDVALKEIAFAASLNKRFAPIVCRRVTDNAVPQALAQLNFIFFDDDARFEKSADTLTEALNTDIEWIRKHRHYVWVWRLLLFWRLVWHLFSIWRLLLVWRLILCRCPERACEEEQSGRDPERERRRRASPRRAKLRRELAAPTVTARSARLAP